MADNADPKTEADGNDQPYLGWSGVDRERSPTRADLKLALRRDLSGMMINEVFSGNRRTVHTSTPGLLFGDLKIDGLLLPHEPMVLWTRKTKEGILARKGRKSRSVEPQKPQEHMLLIDIMPVAPWFPRTMRVNPGVTQPAMPERNLGITFEPACPIEIVDPRWIRAILRAVQHRASLPCRSDGTSVLDVLVDTYLGERNIFDSASSVLDVLAMAAYLAYDGQPIRPDTAQTIHRFRERHTTFRLPELLNVLVDRTLLQGEDDRKEPATCHTLRRLI